MNLYQLNEALRKFCHEFSNAYGRNNLMATPHLGVKHTSELAWEHFYGSDQHTCQQGFVDCQCRVKGETIVQGSTFNNVTGSTPGIRMISPFEISLQTGVLEVPKRYVGHSSTNFGNILSD